MACAKRVDFVRGFLLAIAVIVLGRSTGPSYLSNAQIHAERLPVCYVASTSAFLSWTTVSPSCAHVKYLIASTDG